MEESRLIDLARKGEREALRNLVRLYYPSVLRFLSTLCRNPDDAEELAQETFVKALKGLSKFRGKSGLRTWLHSIAFYEFTHRKRRERTVLALPDDAQSQLFEARSVLALELEHALQCVPEDFRAAFILCDVQELSMNEASEVLGIPVGTVKSRLHTARKRLQALLEPEHKENNHESRIS